MALSAAACVYLQVLDHIRRTPPGLTVDFNGMAHIGQPLDVRPSLDQLAVDGYLTKSDQGTYTKRDLTCPRA